MSGARSILLRYRWFLFLRSTGVHNQFRGRQVLHEVITAYEQALMARGMIDFALLEQQVLDRLCAGALREFRHQIKVIRSIYRGL